MLLLNNPVYGQDDDSTPYMPYPQQPQQEAPKATPKTTKKTQTKKTKKTVKKAAPKKQTKTVKKQSAPKSSSLQKGIELINQSRYEQAKPYLLRAIQENRNDPNVWYWYGVWHEKTGGFYQAQYFYSKAITIDPAFEPLSRVVYYPNDNEKTPLWDPKRPARVYPVETSNSGVTTIPPNAQGRRNFPSAPNDPEIPKVPVYTPPEPGANPLEGDSWAPGIYVPPSREEIQTEGEMSPIYTPPEPQGIVTENRQQIEVPMYNNIQIVNNEVVDEADRDRIIRADLPLYNPPEPGQRRIAQAPKVEQPKQSVQPAKKQAAPTKQQVTIPTSRVVKQSDKKAPAKKVQPAPKPQTKTQQTKKPAQKQNQNKAVSRDVKPSAPAKQPQTKRPEPTRPAPQQPQVQPEIIQEERQQNRQQPEYLPPVGQFAPDPGTIPDNLIPPVGQGSQY